jgi:hypothetical protein
MTIAAMVPVVREALGVSSSYDSVTIPAGIRRSIAFMLRTWTFPQALEQVNIPIANGASQAALPVTGVGKVHAVRIRDTGGTLFKRLRRTLIGELPHSQGPLFYWQEGNLLKLDTPISGTGYSADVWYNSTDVDAADPWITSDFEDIVFTHSTMKLAVEMRKTEVASTFGAIWQEQVPALAQYLNEIEYNDMDIRMKPAVDPPPAPERYGT